MTDVTTADKFRQYLQMEPGNTRAALGAELKWDVIELLCGKTPTKTLEEAGAVAELAFGLALATLAMVVQKQREEPGMELRTLELVEMLCKDIRDKLMEAL